MKGIPSTEQALPLRTDFSDDAAWAAVCDAIQAPVGDFQANVEPVSDRAFEGVSVDELVAAAGDGDDERSFLFVVDRETIGGAEHPVRVIDLMDEPGRTFRVIPSEAWAVENNLSIGNMGFAEFADAVGEDGVFRGFEDA